MNKNISLKKRLVKSKRINNSCKNNECIESIYSCGVPHRAYVNFNIK